jgi:hypothetical protein
MCVNIDSFTCGQGFLSFSRTHIGQGFLPIYSILMQLKLTSCWLNLWQTQSLRFWMDELYSQNKQNL